MCLKMLQNVVQSLISHSSMILRVRRAVAFCQWFVSEFCSVCLLRQHVRVKASPSAASFDSSARFPRPTPKILIIAWLREDANISRARGPANEWTQTLRFESQLALQPTCLTHISNRRSANGGLTKPIPKEGKCCTKGKDLENLSRVETRSDAGRHRVAQWVSSTPRRSSEHIYVYMYIYIYRERDRERDIDI